jgi:cyclohexadieny/prephenate dehydrogenase
MVEQLTILCPGLIGGSVARAARERSAARRIVIWARRSETRRALAGQAWCDIAAGTPEAAVQKASLVVIAAPVDSIIPLLSQIAPHLPAGAIVTDVGSVKREITRQGHSVLGERAHFVGSHPMAGSEKTGWENGSAALFEHRTCFVTPLAATHPGAVKTVVGFWQQLGANAVTVDPEKHDEIVAHISHLPQVLASSLCSFLAGKDPSWKNYAGGGLRDTTRIAASDPKLWHTILEQNRDKVLEALRHMQEELKSFESALAEKNWTEVTGRLERGKKYRDEFPST